MNTAWEKQPCGNSDESKTWLCVLNALSELLDISIRFMDSKVTWDYNFSLCSQSTSVTWLLYLYSVKIPSQYFVTAQCPGKSWFLHPKTIHEGWYLPEGEILMEKTSIEKLSTKACKDRTRSGLGEILGRSSSLWRWWDMVRGCPENFWMPHPGKVQGQAGWGSEQPGLVEGVSANGGGL